MKAKKTDKPRVPKTWRLHPKAIEKASKASKKKKQPESEIIENLIYDYLD